MMLAIQIFGTCMRAAELNPNDVMRELAFGPQALLFSAIAKLAMAYLLLPLGTAAVEQSFSHAKPHCVC